MQPLKRQNKIKYTIIRAAGKDIKRFFSFYRSHYKIYIATLYSSNKTFQTFSITQFWLYLLKRFYLLFQTNAQTGDRTHSTPAIATALGNNISGLLLINEVNQFKVTTNTIKFSFIVLYQKLNFFLLQFPVCNILNGCENMKLK
jgi:hypothetical protein